MLRRTSQDSVIAIPEGQSRVNIKAISEMLSDFNGSEALFKNWERQTRLLITTYQLSDNDAKILLSMRLKDQAAE